MRTKMSSQGVKSQVISPQANDNSNEPSGSIISPPSTSGRGRHEENGGSGIQLRTSARVSKKLKLEAEAAANQSQPEPKETIEIKKPPEVKKEPEKPLKRRAHELWSMDDKNTFFEALNECGKDFDGIAKYMMGKVKKKGVGGEQQPQCSKTRAQVRCFYYRTWHKIAKHLNFPEGILKQTQELYGLINFGEMRKKCGVITVKNCLKLNELIYAGITQIRVKGKTLRVRTPNCRAMRKANQVIDSEEDKIPGRILIEFQPKDKAAWHAVQSLSMNPRLRTSVTHHTKVATLLNYLQKVKWKENKGTLRLAPQPEASISMPSVKRNDGNSNCAFSLLNHEKKFGTPALVTSVLNLLNQIRHSAPGSRKRQRADSSSEKNKATATAVLAGGEGGSSEAEKKNSTSCYEVTLPPFSLPVFTSEGEGEVKEENAPSNTSLTGPTGTPTSQCKTPTTSPNKEEAVTGAEAVCKDLPNPETIRQGWTLDNVHNTQVGHLYSMFGSEGKVVLTYCWEDVKPDLNISATLQHMLLVAKLILSKNTTKASSAACTTCACGHTCDTKSGLACADSAKSPGETFKRPKPKVEPQDEFQAQLDKFQPKSYSKRFRSKNLIVHRVHPLNSPSPSPSPSSSSKSTHSSSPGQSNPSLLASKNVHPSTPAGTTPSSISSASTSSSSSSHRSSGSHSGSHSHLSSGSHTTTSGSLASSLLGATTSLSHATSLSHVSSRLSASHPPLRANNSFTYKHSPSPSSQLPSASPSSQPPSASPSSQLPLIKSLPVISDEPSQDSLSNSRSEASSGGHNARSGNTSNGDTNDFLGNLMDSSLSSTVVKDAAAALDELMDISFPHSEVGEATSSPSSFTGLIPCKEDSISLPPSPSKLLREGEHRWLSSEVGDYSLSSLLGHLESPVKPTIPSDMQSMISESSVDYMAKFADLAAQMANDETCKN